MIPSIYREQIIQLVKRMKKQVIFTDQWQYLGIETLIMAIFLAFVTKLLAFQFIITSKYCVKELQHILVDTLDVFVSIESHFDLFHLTMKKDGSRSTNLEWTYDKMLKLRSEPSMIKDLSNVHSISLDFLLLGQIKYLTQLQSHKRTVVVCSNRETSETVSRILSSRYQIESILNDSKILESFKSN